MTANVIFAGASVAALALAAPAQILRVDGEPLGIVAEQAVPARQGVLERAVQRAVVDALPAMWRVESVRIEAVGPAARADGADFTGDVPARPPALSDEGLRAQVQFLAPPVPGPQWVSVLCQDRFRTVRALRAVVTLQPGVSSTAMVHRGNDVSVIVHSGNITVQARGVAQSDGGVGEQVTVLVESATRTLQATVMGAKEVEVLL